MNSNTIIVIVTPTAIPTVACPEFRAFVSAGEMEEEALSS